MEGAERFVLLVYNQPVLLQVRRWLELALFFLRRRIVILHLDPVPAT